MQTLNTLDSILPESAGYFEVDGAHLYTVLHPVTAPVACVLLAGAFASERQNSYLPWVRWARYLAARQIEVLRFDYRGVGESTGAFEDMNFEIWNRDFQCLADWYRRRSPQVPLLLHGLELGAILAGRAFDAGFGDMLLLWSPPLNANQALRSTLLRWVALEQIFKVGDDRKTASEYIRKLEQGYSLEVEGYHWSGKLWGDSFHFDLPAKLTDAGGSSQAYGKPVRIVKLGRDAAPLVKGGFVGYDEFKDFSHLFADNLEWMTLALQECGKGKQ